MLNLVWYPYYSVGVALLDEQHTQLFGIVGEVASGVERGVSDERMCETLARLVELTNAHFQSEESLMTQLGYPERDAHRREHDLFRNQLASLIRGQREGRCRVKEEDFLRIRQWFVSHLTEQETGPDPKFGRWLANHRRTRQFDKATLAV